MVPAELSTSNSFQRSRSIDISDDEDEPEVVIHLTATNPQAIRKYVKFDITRREYFLVNVGLQAAGFIDHLDIKSTIVHQESAEVTNDTISMQKIFKQFKGQEQLDYNAKKQQEKSEAEGIPINKFLFVERGTQSKSSMARGIETQTEGLPRGIFSGTINK